MNNNPTKTKTKPNPKSTDSTKAELTWLENKTFELMMIIPKADIAKAYDLTLKAHASSVDLPGFRKGKAPLSLIEEKVGKNHLYEEVVNILIPRFYQQLIQKHHLKPIVSPRIQPISMDEDKDWQIKVTACEAPDVKLGDYKKIIREATAKDSIWVPGKDIKESKPKPDKNKKLAQVLQALSTATNIQLATILIDSERDRMLSKLVNQLQKLNITIDNYAQANGKTVNQLQNEYTQLARRNLETEFILQQLSVEEKITVKDEEVEKYLSEVKDESVKKQLDNDREKEYLKLNLIRQKTVDFLLNV